MREMTGLVKEFAEKKDKEEEAALAAFEAEQEALFKAKAQAQLDRVYGENGSSVNDLVSEVRGFCFWTHCCLVCLGSHRPDRTRTRVKRCLTCMRRK